MVFPQIFLTFLIIAQNSLPIKDIDIAQWPLFNTAYELLTHLHILEKDWQFNHQKYNLIKKLLMKQTPDNDILSYEER